MEIFKGKIYGKFTVVSEPYMKAMSKRNRKYIDVSCSCGSPTKSICFSDLMAGKNTSCGCSKVGPITHGMADTRIYSIWASMKKRCDNPSTYKYCDYGGRGITYQKSWFYFENFYSDMSVDYQENLEIDRIDTNGNYTKENCRWASRSVNCHNRRKRKNSSLESIGVSIHGSGFRATLTVDGKPIINKTFKTEKEAALAYDNASEAEYGDRPNNTIREGLKDG